MNKNYIEIVSTITKITRKFVSTEKNFMVSEIIASHIDIPWKKTEISRQLGTEKQVRSRILCNKKLNIWVIKNLIYGLLIFLKMMFSLAKRPKPTEAVCLLYSLTPSQLIQGNCSLRDFLNGSRLGLNINQATHIIIEQPGKFRKRQDSKSNLIYVGNISCYYFEEYLTYSQRINVLFNSFRRVIQLVFTGKFIELLFYRQTILESEIDMLILKKKELTYLITSQSNLRRLPTSFYLKSSSHVQRVMIWYSNNSFVIEKKTEIEEFDAMRNCRSNIDVHFGWGERWKSQLESVNLGSNIRNVGSLMWYTKSSNIVKKPSTGVVVFDVIPFSSHNYYNFYSYGLVSTFLLDVHECVNLLNESLDNNKKYELILKQKREFQNNSHPAYIELLRKLEGNQSFKVFGSDENLYDLIASSKVVIGIPFVSPVFIAKEMCVPCCYYVGDGSSEWYIPNYLDGVEVIVGKRELRKWLKVAL